MTWDLRSKYAFDATEGQIPEGNVSVYGPANSHANCVPASFAAALALAGYGDIDPQRITNEIYGANYRGGFGNFSKAIAWIRANVPNAPNFSDGPFDFNAAEVAGQNGQLVIVAGWVDAPTVTFVGDTLAHGFSHASLLAGHLTNDQFLIWNTWTGQFQTYSRSVMAASLYEMAIMTGGSKGEDDLLADERAWLKAVYDVLSPVSLSQIQQEVIQVQNLLEHGTDASAGNPGSIKIPTTAELLTAIKAVSTSGSGLTQQQVTDAVTAALKGLTLKAQ